MSSQSGYTLNDVLEADFETLMAVLSAERAVEEEEEIMSMEDFMRANPDI